MEALVKADVFPATQQYTYLNAASVAPMSKMTAKATLDWQEDLALRGTVHFDEEAETRVFDSLREVGARLLGARPDEIAGASNASESLCSMAWALSPGPEQNVVSSRIEFPSVVYPWLRVARTTGCQVRLTKDENHVIDPDELLGLIDDRTSHDRHRRPIRVGRVRQREAGERLGPALIEVAAKPELVDRLFRSSGLAHR